MVSNHNIIQYAFTPTTPCKFRKIKEEELAHKRHILYVQNCILLTKQAHKVTPPSDIDRRRHLTFLSLQQQRQKQQKQYCTQQKSSFIPSSFLYESAFL